MTLSNTSRLSEKIPWAALLTLVLMLFFEFGVKFFLPHEIQMSHLYDRFYPANRIPTFEESVIQWQVHSLLNLEKPPDVLLFGDSSCLVGLIPNVFSRQTTLSALNLGTISWLSTAGHSEMLELLVRKCGPPKIAVYHIAHTTLEWSPQYLEMVGYLGRFREWTSSVAGGGLKRNFFLPANLPSHGCFVKLKCLFSKFEDNPNMLTRRGHHLSDEGVRAMLEETGGYYEETRPGNWDKPIVFESRFNSVCIPGLRRMFEISRRYHFPLSVVLVPIPEAARNQKTEGTFRDYYMKLNNIAKEYQNVSIATPIIRYYPNNMCNGTAHLLKSGAVQNSLQLSHAIRNSLN